MKKLILIILSAISIHANSQEFAPPGAKWHYDLRTFNPGLITYQTLEEKESQFNVSAMPAGIYLVKVYTEQGVGIVKVAVNH